MAVILGVLDTAGMAGIDVVKILGYGVLGLGFLLALLAYRLLSKEQGRQTPSPDALHGIYVFMGFSLALCILGLVSQFFDRQPAEQKSDSIIGMEIADAVQFASLPAKQPYLRKGYSNDLDGLEALIQEFLLHLSLHPDTSFETSKPFYAAMDSAVDGLKDRAQANIHRADMQTDVDFKWHTNDSPEWFRTHLHELRTEHQDSGAPVGSDVIKRYRKIFQDWRQGVGGWGNVSSANRPENGKGPQMPAT
ncbi:MAG TPA: hypothetical protein VNW47_15965 [Terriglobales bacterium]|jgi:hypothetical protein|nr:hypothetical protein [Terriglobales bacterium]